MSSAFLDLSRYKRFLFRKLVGGQITYSQLGEDLIVDFLLAYKKKGVYIDIGANDPFVYSNTALFHKKGWHGINIDPNSKSIEKFKQYRPDDINLLMGVGTKGTMTLYEFKESGLNTFDETTGEKNKAMGHVLLGTTKISVLPLREILKEHLKDTHIDILSVDTEGFDLQVLQSNDWNIYRPTFIILETLEYSKDSSGKKTNAQFDEYLKNLGYSTVAETHLNTIYKYQHI